MIAKQITKQITKQIAKQKIDFSPSKSALTLCMKKAETLFYQTKLNGFDEDATRRRGYTRFGIYAPRAHKG
jgi:hypothetical protein